MFFITNELGGIFASAPLTRFFPNWEKGRLLSPEAQTSIYGFFCELRAYNPLLMKGRLFLFVFCLFASSAFAQDKPVPITHESHHHLVLENEYTRVFHVNVPSKQSTLMHQHDLDYVSVQIGATDFTNDRIGAAPAEVKLDNGTVKFAKGGFAHMITILSDAPFENLTIEVKKPSTKSGCGAAWPGVQPEKPYACGVMSENGGIAHTTNFETDAVLAVTYSTGGGTSFSQNYPSLLVALTPLQCACGGPKPLNMKPGDVVWLPIEITAHVSKTSDTSPRFVAVSFK